MRVEISHRTRFEYDQASHDSHNEVRMRPWDGPAQRCLEFEISTDKPSAILAYRDFFGNHTHSVSVSAPHHALTIDVRAVVEVTTPPPSGPYSEVPFSVFLAGDEARSLTYYEFLNASRHVPFSDRLRKFFWMCGQPAGNEDVAAYVMRIVTYVRDQFEYETTKTHVNSDVDDILKSGGGVCQDFAHLTIGVLRLAGVPARYVSGYLVPVSQPHGGVDGDQASHAWLQAWLPGVGWTGFDPTHRCRTDTRHIGVAVGRDYSDVPPLRGVYRSESSTSVMKVELTVKPAIEGESPNGLSGNHGHAQ